MTDGNSPANARSAIRAPADNMNYASPEAQDSFRTAMGIMLELRDHSAGRLARKVRVYERTLGLAVIPVLVRRALIHLGRRYRVRKPRSR